MISNGQLPSEAVRRIDACIDSLQAAERQLPHSLPSTEIDALFRILTEFYDDGSDVIRFRIVSRLSVSKLAQRRRILVRALKDDPSAIVRHEAAFALGWSGDSECVPLLENSLLNDPSELVRHEAAMALADLGAIDAIRSLEKGLNDTIADVASSCQFAIDAIRDGARRFPGD